METNTYKVAKEDLRSRVKEIFAQVTRYPSEILDPQVSLEEDLGIDSVKLGEIFSVLREEYHLPEKIGIPPEKLKTMAGITEALYLFLSERGLADSDGLAPSQLNTESKEELVETKPVDSKSLPVSSINSQKFDRDTLAAEVLDIFGKVTRYPKEILDPQANLEEDLGIDSVKLGEIFSVIREKYDLPPEIEIPPEKLKTIATIIEALYEKLPNLSTTVQNQISEVIVPSQNEDNGSYGVYSNSIKESFASLNSEKRPFEGKIAFVSGSGRGLGKDIAIYLADLGANVIVNSFHSRDKGEETTQEIKSKGNKAYHLWGSMANSSQVHTMFDQIEETYGKLDFFISSASNGMLASLEEITVEDWEKAFRTNIIGLHQSALRAVKLMKKAGGGKIITLSSPAAHGYVEYFGCMGCVKAAVESLTRSLAIEFSKFNIQVNCVSPGPVYGELLNKWPESERLIPQWEDNTPYGRLCKPRDVSHFIAYLLSEPVKLFTGSVLVMDGGISSQGW